MPLVIYSLGGGHPHAYIRTEVISRNQVRKLNFVSGQQKFRVVDPRLYHQNYTKSTSGPLSIHANFKESASSIFQALVLFRMASGH